MGKSRGKGKDKGRQKQNKEDKAMKECTHKIDELISKLQVYGYRITINNHNIGDYHNIYVRRYVPIDIMFFDDTYELKSVDFYVYRLPGECDLLIEALETLLIKASNEWI